MKSIMLQKEINKQIAHEHSSHVSTYSVYLVAQTKLYNFHVVSSMQYLSFVSLTIAHPASDTLTQWSRSNWDYPA